MSALWLRVIACIAMLIDHIGYSLNFMPFRVIGRIAFPIFLYLICNGYRHTSSPVRYALRLAGFAAVSQVPFSLFCYNTIWSANGNVFFTLLMALLCIWAADCMMKHRVLKWFSLAPAIVVFALYHFGVLQSDYGARAILMVMVFFLFDGKKPINRVMMCVACLLSVSQQALVQVYSVAALPFIFAYNGEKGTLPGGRKLGKLVQYGFYAFYPAHLLLLWLIRII